MAILISDIRGFTPLSESLSPEVIISLLNHYFSHMIEVIKKHKGIMLISSGTEFWSFLTRWMVPSNQRSNEPFDAPWRCKRRWGNLMRKEDLPTLEMGIGLTAGQVVVGNIGSETRAEYGIVGSAVNITQRIQESARGGEVVISDSVYQHAGSHLAIKRPFEDQLKGLHEKMKLHIPDSERILLSYLKVAKHGVHWQDDKITLGISG